MSSTENNFAREITSLLLQASTHHLRLTLEELPVGTITITKYGVIEHIDDWTKKKLGFSTEELMERSISVFLEDSAFDFLELIRKRSFGYKGSIRLRTRTGRPLNAELILEPGLRPYRFQIDLIYSPNEESGI